MLEKKHVHPAFAVEMEAIASEKQLQGPAVLVEAARRLGYHHHLSAIFFVEILQLYPYQIAKSCHELLPADTAQREAICEDPSSLKRSAQVNGWITETVNAQRYRTLLREHCRAMFNSTRTFRGSTESLAGAAGYPWIPRSPDLTLVDFWLWGYLKLRRVSIRSIKSVGTERCNPQRSILHTSGHVALCGCWICPLVWNLLFSPCGGGHVEHILV
ncbi:hypothetical protein TNCV_2430181 [Trichonephila clavipes]|nr:hypothetical protein TNCV_2430181 [Trichonephila clavipes]